MSDNVVKFVVPESSKNLENNICFSADSSQVPILRIASDGFYVREVKVPQDEGEAAAVYAAFRDWMDTAKILERSHE